MNFTTTLLDEGSSWNSNTARLNIHINGTYYLKLSGSANRDIKLNLILSVNGRPLMNVVENLTGRTDFYTVCQHAIISRLQQGDQLGVSIPEGYGAVTGYYEVIFAGFLIYPN